MIYVSPQNILIAKLGYSVFLYFQSES